MNRVIAVLMACNCTSSSTSKCACWFSDADTLAVFKGHYV